MALVLATGFRTLQDLTSSAAALLRFLFGDILMLPSLQSAPAFLQGFWQLEQLRFSRTPRLSITSYLHPSFTSIGGGPA